jgi:hypothetical protein
MRANDLRGIAQVVPPVMRGDQAHTNQLASERPNGAQWASERSRFVVKTNRTGHRRA